MQVAPRASSRGTSLANRDSLQPDQKNSSKVAGLAVEGDGGGISSADEAEDAFAFRFKKDAGDSLGRSFVFAVKQPSSLD